MDLELLKRFYITAQEGTIGRAAQKLNVAQSALTRSIQLFEHRMKTQLFERTPKGVRLTPQGERLFAFAKRIIEEAEDFERVFHEKDEEIEGEIRILTTPYVGVHWLLPHMKEFLKKYPKLTLQIILNNEDIESLGEADVAICSLISNQPDLIQELLFPLTVRLFAHPNYLKEFGTPEKAEDLDNHSLIVYKEEFYVTYRQPIWTLNVGRPRNHPARKSYIQIDTLEGMVKAASLGLGIIEAPDLTSILNSELTEVLPELRGPHVPYYFIYNQNRKKSKKINLLLKYLSKKGK